MTNANADGGAPDSAAVPHQIIWSSGASAEDAPACDPSTGSCITCGDEGIPMTVRELDAAGGLARCETATGESSAVDLSLVAGVAAGDVVIVHAGVAIAVALEAQ